MADNHLIWIQVPGTGLVSDKFIRDQMGIPLLKKPVARWRRWLGLKLLG